MAESDLIHKDQYYVAVKVFLKKEGKLLVIKDQWNNWDIPGGRLRKHEFETSLEDVILRKTHEEIGVDVQYDLGTPVVMMRHERIEQQPGEGADPTIRIFAVGYEADWIAGEPEKGEYITEMKWVSIDTFKPEECFAGGWLKGVQDYLALQRNK